MLAINTNSLRLQCLRVLRLPQIAQSSTKYYATSSEAKTAAVAVDEDEDQLERPTFLDDDDLSQRTINTNKSGLLTQHRNMLHGQVPYQEPQSWIHLREKYQRKMYGRYGAASGVDVRICFPTKADLEQQQLQEKLLQPKTLQEMMQIVQKEKLEKQQQIVKREQDIAAKIEKLEKWKQELQARMYKKEADAQAAKERKERLVEEVRRHFGFKVDPKDERFKEMLEQKEKEQKRKDKDAKRKIKEEKMMAKLIQKNVIDDKQTAV